MIEQCSIPTFEKPLSKARAVSIGGLRRVTHGPQVTGTAGRRNAIRAGGGTAMRVERLKGE
jgi:hypothetical protein